MVGIDGYFQVTRLECFHRAIEDDPAAMDEHDIGEHVLDLVHLMRRQHDGAVTVVVIVQQRIVKIFAIQDVQAQRRLVENQQPRVNRHHQREVQLGDHALRQLPDLAAVLDRGLRQEAFRFRAIEARMHARHVVERLRNPHPARQHSDIGNEADVAHELLALRPGISSEHPQLSLIRSQTENRVERGGLARAVGTDESEDATLFNTQIDAVQCNRCAEGLAETACFDACHGLQRSSSFSFGVFAASVGFAAERPFAPPFSSSSAFNPSR